MDDDTLAAQLWADDSKYALRPAGGMGQLLTLCEGAFDTSTERHQAAKKLDSNMKRWNTYCKINGTPGWRPAHNDLTSSLERQREAVLAAGFLRYLMTVMRGTRGAARAKPSSAFKVWLSVRKAHSNRGIELMTSKLLQTVVRTMCHQHLADFGAGSLVPTRKEPFTPEILRALAALPDNIKLGGTVHTHGTHFARALRGIVCTLANTGLRKGEISLGPKQAFGYDCASRALVSWVLRGKLYAVPPPHLLRDPQPGDHVLLTPPVSKSDQFGEIWGASPIYLRYRAGHLLCAFSALAEIELHDPCTIDRHKRPLFSPDGVNAFTSSKLDRILVSALAHIGLAPTVAKQYSWHSARIYLACALLATGASRPQIQVLCRWQTEESLNIYARLNETIYSSLLGKALTASVTSIRTTSIAGIILDGEDSVRALLAADFTNVTADSPE